MSRKRALKQQYQAALTVQGPRDRNLGVWIYKPNGSRESWVDLTVGGRLFRVRKRED